MKTLLIVLACIAFASLFIIFPVFRCAVLHIVEVIYNGLKDRFLYYYHREKHLAVSGLFNAFIGLFGKGKTLTAVHETVKYYKKYNDKKVWWKGRFVTQKVVILSNVELNIPYTPLQSLRQLVELSHELAEHDYENCTRTMVWVLIDEASVMLNSRQFKSNIDSLFLNTMLTCRHYGISIVYTAQRFSTVDALLRVVTQSVFDCDKIWRFQRVNEFDAYELENSNPIDVKPLHRKCWFVRNSDYAAYDTLACVQNLEHSALTDDMLSAQEILEKIANNSSDTTTVVNLDKKSLKRFSNRLKKNKRIS